MPSQICSRIQDVIDSARLLDHPYYLRWSKGDLTLEEIAGYAHQYRFFEEYLPNFLEKIIKQLPDCQAKSLLKQNLEDELGHPEPHLEMFDKFAVAVGCDLSTSPKVSQAMESLIEVYELAASYGPANALGALSYYEMQSAEIALSKAQGLRSEYGLSEDEITFWDNHATMEVDHADWTAKAIDDVVFDDMITAAIDFTQRASRAWWDFLDERESLQPALTVR